MLRLLAIVALSAVAALPLAGAAATIVPVAQTRSVTASTTGSGGAPSSQTLSAGDFASFNRTVGASTVVTVPSSASISASMQQISSIQDARVFSFVTGLLSQNGLAGTAFAESVFDVTFDLTVESDYVLTTNLAPTSPFDWSYEFALTDVDSVVLPLVGTLDPGRYRLTQMTSGDSPTAGNPNTITAGVDLVFTPIPEPSAAALLALGLAALAARRR